MHSANSAFAFAAETVVAMPQSSDQVILTILTFFRLSTAGRVDPPGTRRDGRPGAQAAPMGNLDRRAC
jgi:hypothetical protein